MSRNKLFNYVDGINESVKRHHKLNPLPDSKEPVSRPDHGYSVVKMCSAAKHEENHHEAKKRWKECYLPKRCFVPKHIPDVCEANRVGQEYSEIWKHVQKRKQGVSIDAHISRHEVGSVKDIKHQPTPSNGKLCRPPAELDEEELLLLDELLLQLEEQLDEQLLLEDEQLEDLELEDEEQLLDEQLLELERQELELDDEDRDERLLELDEDDDLHDEELLLLDLLDDDDDELQLLELLLELRQLLLLDDEELESELEDELLESDEELDDELRQLELLLDEELLLELLDEELDLLLELEELLLLEDELELLRQDEELDEEDLQLDEDEELEVAVSKIKDPILLIVEVPPTPTLKR